MERFLDVLQQPPHNAAEKPVQCAEKPIPALFHRLTPVTLCSDHQRRSGNNNNAACFPCCVCGESSSAVFLLQADDADDIEDATSKYRISCFSVSFLLDYSHHRHMSRPPQIACIARPSHARRWRVRYANGDELGTGDSVRQQLFRFSRVSNLKSGLRSWLTTVKEMLKSVVFVHTGFFFLFDVMFDLRPTL